MDRTFDLIFILFLMWLVLGRCLKSQNHFEFRGWDNEVKKTLSSQDQGLIKQRQTGKDFKEPSE